MQIAELDDVHYDLEVDGEQVRKQLARTIWEQRGWATVAIAFQERAVDGTWNASKLALLRFRRINEVWKKQALITLPAPAALALADSLDAWRGHFATDGDGDGDGD